MTIRLLTIVTILLTLTRFSGGQDVVVLYTSIDQPQARAIANDFTARTGIRVTLVTDGEATKTAGLAERIEAEKANPRADVYWNNEVFHTVRLAEMGCFEPLPTNIAGRAPAPFVDTQARWVGVGLRARVIVVNTAEPRPVVNSIHDLIRPEFKDKIAMAHPAFGTTSGHVAWFYHTLGREKFVELFRGLRANNVKLLGGNSVVARMTADNIFLLGLTDNDDVATLRVDGAAIEAIVPDQQADQLGTLLIPSTVSLIKNAKNREAAMKLVDYLTGGEPESRLVNEQFFVARVGDALTLHARPVDFEEVSRVMPEAVKLALSILQDGQ